MRIAIYCSSKNNIEPQSVKFAEKIGDWIGSNNATLVYGGIDLGLMKVVANATKRSGGKVVGVVPATRQSAANKINDESIITNDLNDRKAKMIAMSDVFVVLPGGYGTLDEFISTFTFLSFVGDKNKEVIVVNVDSLFDPTMAQLRLMVERGLMEQQLLHRIKEVKTAEECCNLLDRLNKNLSERP